MSRWMVGSSVASSTKSGFRNTPFSTGGPVGAGGGAAAGEDAHPIAADARRTARYRFRIPEAYRLTDDDGQATAGRRRPILRHRGENDTAARARRIEARDAARARPRPAPFRFRQAEEASVRSIRADTSRKR